MHRSLSAGLILTAMVFLSGTLVAQPTPTDTADYYFDSTSISSTGTVTVTADRLKRPDITVDDAVYRSTIQRTDASDVAAVMYEVPAARVQVNSRGESNLYLRNAGERQVALFFDGALLSVPWDNRVDLSLLPVTAVGGMLISKGAPSVLYGANTMGGAVNIVTRSLPSAGSTTILEATAGENNLFAASATHLQRWASYELFASATYNGRSSLPLPAEARLSYNQIGLDGRTNTDSRSTGIFVRGGFRPGEGDEIALSLNIVDAEKGVAPEGHLDARIDRVRFWRYPDWRWGMLNLSWNVTSGEYDHWKFQGALWGTLFSQQIDQFTDSTYSKRSDIQNDEDRIAGTRMIVSTSSESTRLSLGTTHLLAGHDQIDARQLDDGTIESDPEQKYLQYTGSIGPEVQHTLSESLQAILGISMDVMATLESGNKPAQDLFIEPGATLSSEWAYRPDTRFSLSLGRKSRFPSMRELYGEALNRFLVNPDLTPETAISVELGAEHDFRSGRLGITGFTQLVKNTIDQRNVTVGNDRLRQRYNLEGSRIFGLETGLSFRPFGWLQTDGHVTWSRARTVEPLENGERYLSEKPEWIGTLNVRANLPARFRVDLEALYLGTAYTLGSDDQFVRLPPSTTLNSRLSWHSPSIGPARFVEVYARVNNLLNSVTLNQLGLPGIGREARAGIRITL